MRRRATIRVIPILAMVWAAAFACPAVAEWVDLASAVPAEPVVEIVPVAANVERIEITGAGFDAEPVSSAGRPYLRLRVPGHWYTLERGGRPGPARRRKHVARDG